MKFCAICTNSSAEITQVQLDRGGPLVNVCAPCNDETPIARYSERAYEPPYSAGTMKNAKAPAANRQSRMPTHEQRDGWRTVRISNWDADGKRRDNKDAFALVGDKRAKLVATMAGCFVFQVPPKVDLAPVGGELDALEKYRTK